MPIDGQKNKYSVFKAQYKFWTGETEQGISGSILFCADEMKHGVRKAQGKIF
jgi:hypothetical protein